MYPKKIIRTKDNKEENIELNYIGRRLEKVEVGGKEYKYTYDDQGQRIKKEGNGKEEYYFYEEGRIKEVITKEYRLIYRYVGEEVKGVTYKNENKEISYFYEKNILGEIIGIVDEEGKRVVEYRSSSYGEVENIHDNSKIEISAKDNLRYKGYIYDEETRLYYLKTRYYDPKSINGLNLYVYCGNDLINIVDHDRCFPVLAIILCGIALAGMGLTIGGVASDNNILTAVGLGMVGFTALVSGCIAIAGAILTSVIGGITATAGLGSLGFMSAEIQETTGNGNWIIDTTGMSDGLYNTLLLLLLSMAVIATLVTAASSVSSAFNIKSINGFGKYGDYYGMRFQT